MTKRLTTKEFIERSNKKHDNFYDYSKSIYVGSKKPITIICPVHGEFHQLAANHMRKSGCFNCAEEKKVTSINHFVDVCSKIHNNKYNYDKVVITNLNNFVKITCPEHGEFLQRPTGHMAGHGCRKCSGKLGLDTQEFIRKANIKHKLKYTYNNVECMNSRTKLCITCSVHGEFLQVAGDHLNGHGCQICAGTKKVTTEGFIIRARTVHGDLYEYNNSNIGGMGKKINITCPIHGDFEQRAADHLNGSGCPVCANGKRGQYSIEYFNNFPDQQQAHGILYLAKIEAGWCKVGITKKCSANKRFNTKKVKIVHEINTTLKEAYNMEQEILYKFENQRYTANELRFSNFPGWTECFPISLLPKLIEEFNDRTL